MVYASFHLFTFSGFIKMSKQYGDTFSDLLYLYSRMKVESVIKKNELFFNFF